MSKFWILIMQTLEFVFWLISQFEGKSTAMWDKIIWTQKVFLVIMVWMMVSKRRFWVTIILVNLDRSGDDKSCDFIIVSAPAVLINLNKNSLKWCEVISASHFLYLIFSQILKLTLQQTRIWWRKMGKLENKSKK